jgi:hypothetical protein
MIFTINFKEYIQEMLLITNLHCDRLASFKKATKTSVTVNDNHNER